MALGFLVDQIYLVSSGEYDPHAKNLMFFWFFIYRVLLDCTLINHRSFLPYKDTGARSMFQCLVFRVSSENPNGG